MNWTTQTMVWGLAFINNVINGLQITLAIRLIGAAPKLRLSQDPAFNPTINSTLASLVAGEATFAGYPAGGIAVTVATEIKTGANTYSGQQSFLFVASDSVTPNNIYGYWIDDNTDFIAGEKFDPAGPAAMTENGSYLVIDLAMPVTSIIDPVS